MRCAPPNVRCPGAVAGSAWLRLCAVTRSGACVPGAGAGAGPLQGRPGGLAGIARETRSAGSHLVWGLALPLDGRWDGRKGPVQSHIGPA